jgi:hypothetical protein
MVLNEQAIDTLRDARAKNVGWPRILKAINALETLSAFDDKGRLWVNVAADLTKYTKNQIRQAQRTYAMIDRLLSEDSDKNRNEILKNHSFSHLEIIARIANIDPDSALKYLRMKSLPYRDLKYVYDQLKAERPGNLSPVGIGQLASQALLKLCKFTIESHKAAFDGTGEMQVQKWPEGFEWARPAFIGVIEKEKDIKIDGFSCCNIHKNANRDAIVRFIIRVATESTFFQTFNILLPASGPLGDIHRGCQTLGLTNVRLVLISESGEPPQEILAPSGLPQPDRHHLLTQNSYFLSRLRRLRA